MQGYYGYVWLFVAAIPSSIPRLFNYRIRLSVKFSLQWYVPLEEKELLNPKDHLDYDQFCSIVCFFILFSFFPWRCLYLQDFWVLLTTLVLLVISILLTFLLPKIFISISNKINPVFAKPRKSDDRGEISAKIQVCFY